MSEDTHAPRPDETQPVLPAAASPDATPPTSGATHDPVVAEAATPARPRFRDRLRRLRSSDGSRTFGLGALIASALAGIIVGGLGTAAIHAVTHDGPGDRGGWVQREDRESGGGPDGMHGGPHGVPGQVPPTTAPEDEGSAG